MSEPAAGDDAGNVRSLFVFMLLISFVFFLSLIRMVLAFLGNLCLITSSSFFKRDSSLSA